MPSNYTTRKLSARYPTDLKAWQALKAHYADMRGKTLAELFSRDKKRADNFMLEAGKLTLDYSYLTLNEDDFFGGDATGNRVRLQWDISF